jgi:uncharacterized protein (TIGR00290 family)
VANQEVVLYWSGGKDCATALYDLRTEARYQGYEVSSLLTTLTDSYDRISGHGVRNSVLDRQAHCLGLSVHKTYIPPDASMDQYDSVIETALLEHRARGTKVAATGDIFVEKRRMSTIKSLGLRACCPLLRKQSIEHFKRIVSLGFQAYVVCVDASILDESFVGCLVDDELLNRLPARVDPCGENGEYHTFVCNGPMFREPVPVRRGEVVFRAGFWYCDLVVDC